MKTLKRIVSVILIPLIALFIVYLPRYASDDLHRNRFNEWLMHEEEPFAGSITIWHIVEFKPYVGSLGNLLKSAAGAIEKKHFGVYVNIEAISVEEAKNRITEGKYPDAFSFPAGFCDETMLLSLNSGTVDQFEKLTYCAKGMVNSSLYALPYAASCRLFLYYPSKYTPNDMNISDSHNASDPLNAAIEPQDMELAEQNSFEDFKKGKVDFCIADVRAAGDLQRSVLTGKAEYFEAVPFENCTELVQYLGIYNECPEQKVSYIIEFFASIYSKHNRAGICELGLYPIGIGEELKYEQDFLNQAYLRIQEHLDQMANFIGQRE